MLITEEIRLDALRFAGIIPADKIMLEKYKDILSNVEGRLSFVKNLNEHSSIVYKIFDFPCPKSWGKDVAEHLKGCSKYALFAVTLGVFADRVIMASENESTSALIFTDTLCSSVADKLADKAEANIKNLFSKNTKFTTRFSAGYGDFPLSAQKEILERLSAWKKIGLSVNESYMLTPMKSITAVMGIVE